MYMFFFTLLSIMVYHRILNTVICALQQDLVGYSPKGFFEEVLKGPGTAV